MRRELKTLMTEQQQAGTRALSDMDARMNAVKQRMATLEDALDAKVASVSDLVYLPPLPHYFLPHPLPETYGPRHEKTCLRSFQHSEIQTSLLTYRD